MLSSYLDFTLTVGAATPDGYPVTVRGPGGDARGVLRLPADDPEYVDLAGRLKRLDLSETEIAALGQLLFRALLSGPIKAAYDRSVGALTEGQGLRLRLDIDPREAAAAALPWEYLHDPDRGPLVLHNAPLVRYLPAQSSVPSLKVALPLQVLLTAAQTEPKTEVTQELEALRSALAGLGSLVELTTEEHLTADRLQDLLRQEFHIWHFVGHGGLDRAGTGRLMLEDGNGDSVGMNAPTLATLLGASPVRLAVLNACQGAELTDDPLRALAPALVAAGTPAVVAMQFAVAEESARAFAQEFYQALAEGFAIDSCVTEGRKAVLGAVGVARPDWGIPVLYTRAPDGMLFDLQPAPKPPCPYPGMVPFQAKDARFFYGREHEIEEMLRRLETQNRLVVIGPSGSGKSSLLRAGLIPRLAESTLFPPDTWLIREFRPGSDPGDRLAEALGNDREKVRVALDRAPRLIDDLLAANPPATRLLLLIDQFEELFTLTDRSLKAKFLDTLRSIRHLEHVTLLVAMRADFFPELMSSPLWPIDPVQRIEVAPLRGDALRAAIEGPAQSVGVRLENGLVGQLLDDASDEPGVLPLIQETMRLLWERMPFRIIPLSAYTGLGRDGRSGLTVAIADRADATLAAMAEAQKPVARRILLRLVQFGEGRADTRRQQREDELRVTGEDPALFDSTLKALVDSRLLTLTSEEARAATADPANPIAIAEPQPPARRSSLVDISHEALLSGWPTLRAWIDERRASELTRRTLEEQATSWEELKREGGLLDSVELQKAQQWFQSPDAEALGCSTSLIELVTFSQAAIEEAEYKAQQAQQQKLDDAQKVAEAQHEIARRTRRFAIGVGVVAIFAIVIAVIAGGLYQESQANKALADQNAAEARQRERIAQAGALAAEAQLVRESAPQRAALLALEAQQATQPGDGRVIAADQALQDVFATLSGRPIDQRGAQIGMVPSPDGQRIATWSTDGTVLIWDLNDLRQPVVALPAAVDAGPNQQTSLAFSVDGQMLRTVRSRQLHIWNLGTSPPLDYATPVRLDNPAFPAVHWSRDGRRFVLSSEQGAEVWTLDESNRLTDTPLTLPDVAQAFGLSADGRWLVGSTIDQDVLLVDLQQIAAPDIRTLTELYTSPTPQFSSDGRWLVGTNDEPIALLWDLQKPDSDPISVTGSPDVFSPDSHWLLTNDGERIYAWDLAAPDVTEAPLTFESVQRPLAIGSDGVVMAAEGNDEVEIRHLDREDTIFTFQYIEGADSLFVPIFSPNGSTLLTTDDNGKPQLWSLRSAIRPRALSLYGHDGALTAVVFAPDSQTLVTASTGEPVRVWNLAEIGRSIIAGDERVIELSENGRWLLTSGFTDEGLGLLVRDLSAPAETQPFELPGAIDQLRAIMSPAGEQIALVGREPGIQLWQIGENEPQAVVFGLETVYNPTLAFSRDGRLLATTTINNTVQIWDTGAVPPVLLHELSQRDAYSIDGLAFSPDGERLAVAGYVQTDAVWIYTLAALDQPALTLLDAGPMLAWSPDSRTLVTGGTPEDLTIAQVWDVSQPETGGVPVPRTRLRGHEEAITLALFSPISSRTLVTISNKGTARLWHLDGATDPAPLVIEQGGSWVAFGNRGRELVTLDGSGVLRRWPLDQEESIRIVCGRIGRNLTWAEWQSAFGQSEYQSTCRDLPLHPSFLDHLLADAAAQSRLGNIDAALALFAEVQKREPAYHIAASSWNRLCWDGAVWGHVRDVLDACGQAVAASPNDGSARKSRGLARALTGDRMGAIDDFVFSIDWTKVAIGTGQATVGERANDEAGIALCEHWVAELRAGRNPFDEAQLRELRGEQ